MIECCHKNAWRRISISFQNTSITLHVLAAAMVSLRIDGSYTATFEVSSLTDAITAKERDDDLEDIATVRRTLKTQTKSKRNCKMTRLRTRRIVPYSQVEPTEHIKKTILRWFDAYVLRHLEIRPCLSRGDSHLIIWTM